MTIELVNHLEPNTFYGSESQRKGMLIVFADDVGTYHLAAYANSGVPEGCEDVNPDYTTDWFETEQALEMCGYALTAEYIAEMVEKLPPLLERYTQGEDTSQEIEAIMQVYPMTLAQFQDIQAEQAPAPGGM